MTLAGALTFLVIAVGVLILTGCALMGVAMTIASREFKNLDR